MKCHNDKVELFLLNKFYRFACNHTFILKDDSVIFC